MIRHSNSLLISIFIHITLFIVLVFVYENFFNKPKKEEEVKLCMKLCHVAKKKPEPIVKKKVIEKPKPKPLPKKVEKPKPKKKPKPKIEKKVVKKKIVAKKKVLVVKEKIPPKEIEIVENIAPVIIEKVVFEEPTPVVIQETSQERAKRVENDYLDEHIKKIITLLRDNLYYPRSARKRGITGEVIVKFELLQNGEVKYVEVTSSKSEILTRAAIKTINDLSGDFPKPQEDLTLHVPISYSLK